MDYEKMECYCKGSSIFWTDGYVYSEIMKKFWSVPPFFLNLDIFSVFYIIPVLEVLKNTFTKNYCYVTIPRV